MCAWSNSTDTPLLLLYIYICHHSIRSVKMCTAKGQPLSCWGLVWTLAVGKLSKLCLKCVPACYTCTCIYIYTVPQYWYVCFCVNVNDEKSAYATMNLYSVCVYFPYCTCREMPSRMLWGSIWRATRAASSSGRTALSTTPSSGGLTGLEHIQWPCGGSKIQCEILLTVLRQNRLW